MEQSEKLKQTIALLRSKLAAERKYYIRNREAWVFEHPEEWQIIDKAIKAVAFYYHGEIVRSKHDTANFMNGLDTDEDYGADGGVEAIHLSIAELPRLFKEAEDGTEITKSILQSELDLIKEATTEVEGASYGEQ